MLRTAGFRSSQRALGSLIGQYASNTCEAEADGRTHAESWRRRRTYDWFEPEQPRMPVPVSVVGPDFLVASLSCLR
jgi:hypothetical protein